MTKALAEGKIKHTSQLWNSLFSLLFSGLSGTFLVKRTSENFLF